MKFTEVEDSIHHHVLLFGPPKSGKTELAGGLTTDFDLLLFDLERGAVTLRKLPKPQQERINIISLPDTRSYPIAAETMLKVIRGTEQPICVSHGKIRCSICTKASAPFDVVHLNALPSSTIVVVDSLTQLTNSLIAHITKEQDEMYKLLQDDWGNLGKLMDTFLSHVQQAKFNIVCISHETEVEMEDKTNKLVPTAGTRNFSRNTAKYFDEVIYVEVKNKKHIAASSTTYANKILTGSRTGFRLEDMSGAASLVPIFKGIVPQYHAGSERSKDTPAAISVDKLQAMRDRLAAANKPKLVKEE